MFFGPASTVNLKTLGPASSPMIAVHTVPSTTGSSLSSHSESGLLALPLVSPPDATLCSCSGTLLLGLDEPEPLLSLTLLESKSLLSSLKLDSLSDSLPKLQLLHVHDCSSSPVEYSESDDMFCQDLFSGNLSDRFATTWPTGTPPGESRERLVSGVGSTLCCL